jgi:hypothetical protein
MSEPTQEDYNFAMSVGVVLFCALITTFLLWMVCAEWWKLDAHAHKVEAVKHGCAEWRTDAEGKVSFHWLDNRKEKP